jgi:hypothetical protein
MARPTVWTASQQGVEDVLAGSRRWKPAWVARSCRGVLAVRQLLTWLAGFPGETWQQRWLASGADMAGKAWTDLPNASGATSVLQRRRSEITGAAGRLIMLDVIRPSYVWLYSAPRTRSTRGLNNCATLLASLRLRRDATRTRP